MGQKRTWHTIGKTWQRSAQILARRLVTSVQSWVTSLLRQTRRRQQKLILSTRPSYRWENAWAEPSSSTLRYNSYETLTVDKDTRNAIEKATQRSRKLLEEDFAEQLEGTYDVLRSGSVASKGGAHLTERQHLLRAKIVAAIEHKCAAGMK